jgi:hypothetical protein
MEAEEAQAERRENMGNLAKMAARHPSGLIPQASSSSSGELAEEGEELGRQAQAVWRFAVRVEKVVARVCLDRSPQEGMVVISTRSRREKPVARMGLEPVVSAVKGMLNLVVLVGEAAAGWRAAETVETRRIRRETRGTPENLAGSVPVEAGARAQTTQG